MGKRMLVSACPGTNRWHFRADAPLHRRGQTLLGRSQGRSRQDTLLEAFLSITAPDYSSSSRQILSCITAPRSWSDFSLMGHSTWLLAGGFSLFPQEFLSDTECLSHVLQGFVFISPYGLPDPLPARSLSRHFIPRDFHSPPKEIKY